MATTNNTTARGAFVQNQQLSGVGLAGTDFVKKPVVDQSGWYAGQAAVAREANERIDLQTIGSGIEAGLKGGQYMAKGFILNDVEQQTDSLVDDYIASINVEQNATDSVAYDNMSNSLWKSIGTDPSSVNQAIAGLNVVGEKHKETINKLSRAYKEGAITSLSDLEARVLKVTREAVNRTPGMAQEIMNHTQQVMHLSGVRGMVNPNAKAAEQAAKQQQFLQQKMIAYATTNKIPVDLSNPDYEQLNQDINAHMKAHNINEAHKAAIANNQRIEEHQRIDYVRKVAPNVAYATTDNARAAAGAIFSDPTMSFADQKVTFRLKTEELLKATEHDMATAGAFKDAEGRKQYDNLKAGLKNMVESVESYASGADVLKDMQTRNSIIGQHHLSLVQNKINLVAVDAAVKLDPIATMLGKKEKAAYIETTTKDLLGMMSSTESLDTYNLIPGINNATSTIGGMVMSGNHSTEVTRSFEALNNILKTNASDPYKVEKLTEHYRELGNPDRYKGKIKNPDYAFDGAFSKLSQQYLDGVGKMLKQSVKDANTQLGIESEDLRSALPYLSPLSLIPGANGVLERGIGAAETQEVRPRFKIVDKTGYVSVEVANDTARGEYAAMWQRDISARVNDVISTYSNIMNVSTKQASDLVMSQYGHMLGIPKEELPNVKPTEMIQQEEGFRNTAYDDGFGNPTIGYGFTTVGGVPVKYGDTMTRDEANAELQRQLPKYQTFKNKIKVDLTEDQEAALTSFEFNLGSGIWDKGAKDILYAVNSGDFEHAVSKMRQYDKARDKKTGQLKQIPGLSSRRGREGDLLRG